MVKRLKELEERIVESEAWSEEEPLYSLMRHEGLMANSNKESEESKQMDQDEIPHKVMKVDLSTSNSNNNNITCVPYSPRKAIEVISQREPTLYGTISISNEAQKHVEGTDSSQTSSKLTKLELFFRKFFRLLHLRLHSFTRKLNLSEGTAKNVWDTMVYALEREGNMRLLHGRHMDQLLICSIYGICKIMDEERKFKEIINVYREQPQFAESVGTNINLATR